MTAAASDRLSSATCHATRVSIGLSPVGDAMLLALAVPPATVRPSVEQRGVACAIDDGSGPPGLPDATAQARHLPAALLVYDIPGRDMRGRAHVTPIAAPELPVREIAPETDPAAAETVRRGIAALRAHAQVEAPRIGMPGFGAGSRATLRAPARQAPFAARAIPHPGCASLAHDLPEQPTAADGRLLPIHGANAPAHPAAVCATLAGRFAGSLPPQLPTFGAGTCARDVPASAPPEPWLHPGPGNAGRRRNRPCPTQTAFSGSEAASFLSSALRHGAR